MTAAEMEDVLRNLDLRLSNVEQILPTLATKEDLKAFATREEMRELFADLKRHDYMLFEKTQKHLELIAAQLADISERLPPR